MHCVMCQKPEMQSTSAGNFHEIKTDSRKTAKTNLEVTGRLCSGCCQDLLGMKIAQIPWDGDLEKLKALKNPIEESVPILRRRKV